MESQDLIEAEEEEVIIPLSEITMPDEFQALLETCPVSIQEHIQALENVVLRTKMEVKRASELTDKAYESKRALDQQFMAYKNQAEQKLMFMQSAVNNIQQAMRLIGGF